VRKGVPLCALYAVLLLGVLILCIPACSTLGTVTSGDSYLFSGTRTNIKLIGPYQDGAPFRDLARCVAIFDFPCSLALDIALVPFTLPMQLIVGDKHDSSAQPPREKDSDQQK
jgi:uncharacterized protein YceK